MISLERPLFETLEVPQGWPLNPALRWPTAVWTASEWLRTRLIAEAAAPLGSVPPTRVQTARGWAASFATGSPANNRIRIASDADTVFPSTTQATIAILRRCRDTTARNNTQCVYNSGGAGVDRVSLHPPFGDGNLYWDFGNSTAGSGRISVAFTKTTNWETLIVVAGGGKGREVWRNGVRIASNTSATASRNTVSVPFCLGGYSGAVDNEADNVDVALFVVSAVAWSDAECKAWCANPFAATFAPMLEWLPDAAGGGSAADLTIADASHAHAADNLALTTASSLTVADATHAHAADNLALTTASSLTVADAAHAHTADNLALTTASILTVADAAHAQAADNLGLSLGGSPTLTVADAAHAHTADALSLSAQLALAVQDALHAHTSDQVGIYLPGAGPLIRDPAALGLRAPARDRSLVLGRPRRRLGSILTP